MPIISLSLPEELLKELDNLKNEREFANRSEVIRAGINLVKHDQLPGANFKGVTQSILIMIHKSGHTSEKISLTSHKFRKIITAQMHNHTESGQCLEIFLLKGQTNEIRSLFDNLRKLRKIELIKLIPY